MKKAVWKEKKGEGERRGKERKEKDRADEMWICVCSASHSSAFQQEDWKSSEERKIYFLNMFNYGEKPWQDKRLKKQPQIAG